jgi:hypothetical protein
MLTCVYCKVQGCRSVSGSVWIYIYSLELLDWIRIQVSVRRANNLAEPHTSDKFCRQNIHVSFDTASSGLSKLMNKLTIKGVNKFCYFVFNIVQKWQVTTLQIFSTAGTVNIQPPHYVPEYKYRYSTT